LASGGFFGTTGSRRSGTKEGQNKQWKASHQLGSHPHTHPHPPLPLPLPCIPYNTALGTHTPPGAELEIVKGWANIRCLLAFGPGQQHWQ